MLSGKITPHLSWAEATVTEHRDLLALQTPSPDIQENIRYFAENYFEAGRRVLGAMRVNSLYRSPTLNRVVKGAKNSRHMLGLAADVWPLHRGLLESFKVLVSLHIYDQLIWEFGRWIHMGAPPPGQKPRHEVLMIFEPGKYEPFDADDPRVEGGGYGDQHVA